MHIYGLFLNNWVMDLVLLCFWILLSSFINCLSVFLKAFFNSFSVLLSLLCPLPCHLQLPQGAQHCPPTRQISRISVFCVGFPSVVWPRIFLKDQSVKIESQGNHRAHFIFVSSFKNQFYGICCSVSKNSF